MATFTMCLWEVREYFPDDIGLNDYEIFDESYRETLNKKIYNHYINREIGVETAEMFIFNLRRRMDEIMPLYNQLYENQRREFDPLITMSIETTGTSKNENKGLVENESETSNTAKSSAEQLESQYPQVGRENGGEYANAGASSASVSEGGGSGKDKSESTSSQDANTTSKSVGFQGSQSDLIMAYARSRQNVDVAIIMDLSDLFMGIWGTSDDYTSPVPPSFSPPNLPTVL